MFINSTNYLSNAVSNAGDTSFSVLPGGNGTGHSGNGCARITLIE